MRDIQIDKVVVNIGVGEAGEKLIKAEKVLELITGRKPIRTLSRTTNKDLGIRKGMPIGCKVTLRGEDTLKFLTEAFWVKDNKIADYSFDPEGNFSFGVADYTDFKEQKYDPDIGIFGLDICVTLKRPGLRVKKRKRTRSKIPMSHKITPEESKRFVKAKLNVEVVG
ncbi:MAG: 50S ribosomal protein L5 [Thermoplasmata archaeon]|nr:MAG: 50S ribosomal protein L5 [Thermoplasmata archaeon]